MRIVVTLVIALAISTLAGAVLAALMAEWAHAAESYILVFLAIAPSALIPAAIFLLAGTRHAQKAAIAKTGRVLLWIIGILFVPLAVVSFIGAASTAQGVREVKLATALAAVCAVIVVVQWMVFRWRLPVTQASDIPR